MVLSRRGGALLCCWLEHASLPHTLAPPTPPPPPPPPLRLCCSRSGVTTILGMISPCCTSTSAACSVGSSCFPTLLALKKDKTFLIWKIYSSLSVFLCKNQELGPLRPARYTYLPFLKCTYPFYCNFPHPPPSSLFPPKYTRSSLVAYFILYGRQSLLSLPDICMWRTRACMRLSSYLLPNPNLSRHASRIPVLKSRNAR